MDLMGCMCAGPDSHLHVSVLFVVYVIDVNFIQQHQNRMVINCFIQTIHSMLVLDISLGPGRFTITSVTIGAAHDLINVTFVQVSHVTTLSC